MNIDLSMVYLVGEGKGQQGNKRKRVVEEEENLVAGECSVAAGGDLEDVAVEENDKKEQELQHELEDIEEDLREEEEMIQQSLEEDLMGAMRGEVSNIREEESGDAGLDLHQGEKEQFERWVEDCKKKQEHVYITNVVTGECSCPDQSTVGYVCKHLFRALQLSGKTMLDLPSSVVNAPHLSNDVEVCRTAFIDSPIEQQDDCGSFDWGHVTMTHPDVVKVTFEPTTTPEDAPELPAPGDAEPPLQPSGPTIASTSAVHSQLIERAAAEKNLAKAKAVSQSKWLQEAKVITSWANLEMPDEVYMQLQQMLSNCADAMREVLKAATVPGEFTVVGKAKGSRSRTPHSITNNKSLRGTKRNADGKDEFVKKRGRGRPRENKSALPRWDTLKKLGDLSTVRRALG